MDASSYDQIKADAISFLKENFVMELATASDNKPAVAPVVYLIDEAFNFYFVTYRASRKAQNLIQNPQCSFTIWQFLQKSIQADGTAQVVEDEAKKEWVMDAFADTTTRYTDFWAPIFRIKGGDYCIFKITPTHMSILDLTRSTIRQEESPRTDIKLWI